MRMCGLRCRRGSPLSTRSGSGCDLWERAEMEAAERLCACWEEEKVEGEMRDGEERREEGKGADGGRRVEG